MAGCDSGHSERPAGGTRAGELTSGFPLLVSVTGGTVLANIYCSTKEMQSEIKPFMI